MVFALSLKVERSGLTLSSSPHLFFNDQSELKKRVQISQRPEAENSAIPRPSSRLGTSNGPSSSASPAPNSNLMRSIARPRESFDGNKSISSIPLPSNGLSKSTNRRPTSRLSNVGGAGRETPPLPRSVTPDMRSHNAHAKLRGGSVSPSKPQHPSSSNTTTSNHERTISPSFLNEEPPSHHSNRLPLSASIRRRSSVSNTATGIARPRGSSVGTSVATANGKVSSSIASRLAAENKERIGNDQPGGPPSSWNRIGTSGTPARARTSSSVRESAK